ncbi:MAK1-like monooxygenase [Penicillium canescens]|uniref:MAK1-like monooxygenase n=1 Tax=Penicillium canescens TaxID=5083 RepID=A0AAD6N730_PENCN|nr:MAK1-like monooxygenase [Penicillium canescens]KAJ6038255.1 MAK1-like monooxygenase [Penicillium canescens]KAJ6039626.1 MAK1-like monooxygenase [Penicillium canescens]KAJ6068028.1 MAK1-like monooxygenase [Penicillium canescens]KAJ6088029.1 MAK1-like monooxygenase [Penicillium canescens]KAJ6181470.1 MAK1-like monooxygenase [Penicillium canescens]
MTLSSVRGPDAIAEPRSSGINVIVVGLGIGGLAAAIECHRKGHLVTILEKASSPRAQGDCIGIGTNAARVVSKWGTNGQVHRQLEAQVSHVRAVDIHDHTGAFIVTNEMSGFRKGDGYFLNRCDLANILYKHTQELGIEVKFSARVSEYFETHESAGVIVNGQRMSADCVIASDGVHSKARGFVTDMDPSPVSSGYAAFRAYFDADEITSDPEANWLLAGAGKTDQALAFVGRGCELTMCTVKLGQAVMWIFTHADPNGNARESWTAPANVQDVLDRIKDWPCWGRIAPIIKRTPAGKAINFPLLTRPPLETWLSPERRVLLVGDAAHPYLPMAGQGASQAIEDAAVLAIALELSGKENVPLGLQAAEKIRHHRATLIQTGGKENHDSWHQPDWDAIKENPDLMKTPRPTWILGHDCQSSAYEELPIAVEAILLHKEYVPVNIPAEGMHRANDFKGLKQSLGGR